MNDDELLQYFNVECDYYLKSLIDEQLLLDFEKRIKNGERRENTQ